MDTRYFLVMDGQTVIGRVNASRADWSGVDIPAIWQQVEASAADTPIGSVRQPDGSFVPPPPPVVARRLAKFAFLGLLTPAEYAAMFGQQSDPQLAYGVAMFQAAPDPFDIDNPLVAQMLDYCVQVNALSPARRAALWAGMEAAARA